VARTQGCDEKTKDGGVRRAMSKKKYTVRAECPSCACGDVSFLGPDKLREKFIGDEKEIEILCPMCGTKHKGKIEEEKE
jgi:flavorubredoxin